MKGLAISGQPFHILFKKISHFTDVVKKGPSGEYTYKPPIMDTVEYEDDRS